MSTRLQLQHRYPVPSDRIGAVLVDPDFLTERLRNVGGAGAELISRTEQGAAVTVVQLHRVPPEKLPGLIRKVLPGALTIERTETWNAGGNGTIAADVKGAPGTLTGTTRIGAEPMGSVVTYDLLAEVSIPMVGKKVEAVVGDKLKELLDMEHTFMLGWLQTHPG